MDIQEQIVFNKMRDRSEKLMTSLASLQSEVSNLPDLPEFAKLFEINEEVQNEMLFFMEDYLDFIRLRLLALEESLKFFTEGSEDENEIDGVGTFDLFD